MSLASPLTLIGRFLFAALYQHLWLAFCDTFEWREGAEEIGQAHMTISPVSRNHTGMTIIARFLGAIQALLLVAWLSHYRGNFKHTALQLYIYVHLLVDSTPGSGLYWLPFIMYNLTLQAFHRPTFDNKLFVQVCSTPHGSPEALSCYYGQLFTQWSSHVQQKNSQRN